VTGTDRNAIETLYNVALFGEQEWSVYGVAPVRDNAALHLEDDFTDNRNNWGSVEPEDTSHAELAGGEYCLRIKASDSMAWEWYEPFRADEFIAEVSCYVDGEHDASCGLGFGPDSDNLLWFEVSAYDQYYRLRLLEEGVWQESLIHWSESKYIDPNGMNNLAIDRIEGYIAVLVNGIIVDEVWYDGFPEGRVGLGGSTYNSANATVCLDNLRIWRIETRTAL
jgi:hypothetical protein